MESPYLIIEIRLIDDALATECGLMYIDTMYCDGTAVVAEYCVVNRNKLVIGLLRHHDKIKIYHASPELDISLM